jgi:hypothetical protein
MTGKKSTWEFRNWLYSDLGEIPDETGTDCALSYNCVGADGLGGEGFSHGPSFRAGGLETEILICEPRIQRTTSAK